MAADEREIRQTEAFLRRICEELGLDIVKRKNTLMNSGKSPRRLLAEKLIGE